MMSLRNIVFLLAQCLLMPPLTGQDHSGIHSPYQPGERLDYLIHYGFINGGRAELYVEADTLFGKRVNHVVINGWTIGIANVLYRVRDIYQSYIDPETDLPVKAIRDISEGRYKRYNEVIFDHVSRPDSSIVHSQASGVHVVPKNIHDILSGFYYFRKYLLMDNLKKGQLVEIPAYFTDELFPLIIRYVGKETVRTKVGKIECYKFNPVTEVGRLFETEDDMSVWFSRDENLLPVKIRFDIFVGSVQVDLVQYRGLSHEFESLKTRK